MSEQQDQPTPLEGPMTDEDIAALMARNEERLKQAREQLGKRWIFHPANHTQRKEAA